MTEKRRDFLKRLKKGVGGNDSIRPSYNPHQNLTHKSPTHQMRSKNKK